MYTPYFICPWFACRTLKIPKIFSFLQGAVETSRLTWHNPFGHWSTQSAIAGQIDQNALINPRLTKSQSRSKSSQITFFIFLHQTWATQWFSSTLTKFDSRLTFGGTKNPNFDLTIEMGWDQHHFKDYWIPFTTTIHGSKSKLKQLRCPRNRAKHISSLLEAITFDPIFRI